MASKKEYPFLSGHPGSIPQEDEWESQKYLGWIDYWARIDDIDDIGAALGEIYDNDYQLAVILFKELMATRFGQGVIKNAEEKGIITSEEFKQLRSGSNLKDFGFFD